MHVVLDRPVAEVALAELVGALAGTGDEDDRWEAKRGTLRPEHVFRAVAGLANRDGLLLLGASRAADGSWSVDGSRFPTEPGTWLARVVRDNLRPPPPHALATFKVSPGRFAALVRVEPHPFHLSVIADGPVFRREHGSTEPVDDGAELTRLVRARSATSRAAPLNADAAPDDLADAALGGDRAGWRAAAALLRRRLHRSVAPGREVRAAARARLRRWTGCRRSPPVWPRRLPTQR